MQYPLDVPLIQFGRRVRGRRWFHTCSGEHAAMLKGMRLMGISRAGYTSQAPVGFPVSGCTQKNDGKPDWEPLRVAKDGCGLPTVSNTVDELAVMMAGLASEKDDDWIWDAMTKNPDLVGGFNKTGFDMSQGRRGENPS